MDFMDLHTNTSIGMEYILNLITPRTPYGVECKKNMKYYSRGEEQILMEELNTLEELISLIRKYNAEFNEIGFILKDFKEIRTSLKRIENEIAIDEVELFEIKNFLLCVKDISRVQNAITNFPEGLKVNRSIKLEELLDPMGFDNRTFYIYDCYSEKLKHIREEKRALQRLYDNQRKKIINIVEDMIQMPVKLSGEIIIPKRDETRLKQAIECPYIYEESSSKSYITFRIKKSNEIIKLLNEIEELNFSEEQEEYNVRKSLSLIIKDNIDAVKEQIKRIAYFDLMIAKAEFALEICGTKPLIHDDLYIEILNGRHIKLDTMLKKKGRAFTPLSCSFKKGVTVITGANMGGKTVRLRLIGMLQAMAQLGLFVPAESFKTCIMDYLYFSIGDMQSMDSGLSTFGGEISSMIDIMKYSNHRGMILIDELARGTNPEEGYAISRAIVRYLKNRCSITIFVTHFSGITQEEGIEHLRVKGLKGVDFIRLKEELEKKGGGMDYVQEHMDYTLEKVCGEDDVPRDAINIARLMGLSEEILSQAEEILVKEGRNYNG